MSHTQEVDQEVCRRGSADGEVHRGIRPLVVHSRHRDQGQGRGHTHIQGQAPAEWKTGCVDVFTTSRSSNDRI